MNQRQPVQPVSIAVVSQPQPTNGYPPQNLPIIPYNQQPIHDHPPQNLQHGIWVTDICRCFWDCFACKDCSFACCALCCPCFYIGHLGERFGVLNYYKIVGICLFLFALSQVNIDIFGKVEKTELIKWISLFHTSAWWLFLFITLLQIRIKVSKYFVINEWPFTSCCYTFFFMPCSLTQVYKTSYILDHSSPCTTFYKSIPDVQNRERLLGMGVQLNEQGRVQQPGQLPV